MNAIVPSKMLISFDEQLRRVESLMHRLARGDRVDRTGQMALEQLSSGGKRFRAKLALRAARALGVDEHDAVVWAAAVELLHNATLIHDDVQDEDTTRRGAPTLWVSHGVAQAINAGDFMLMLPFVALGEMHSPKRAELSTMLARSATDIVRGQVEELGLRKALRLDGESYVSAARGKTGALIALPVLGAAILAGRTSRHAADVAAAFIDLGLLFQIQDDVVDVFGEKGRTERGCDIYEGKVSALVVAQLAVAPETRPLVLSILDKPRAECGPEDVEQMAALFVESGALDLVLQQLVELESEILGHSGLRAEPGLLAVAEKLVEMALGPVKHLLRLEAREA